jgi:protein-tyrosine phosphatase
MSSDREMRYHWITPTIAIGDYETPNLLVDLTIDLNYPDNHCKVGEIVVLGNVVYVGLHYKSLSEVEVLLDRMMTIIRETPHRKILFKCEVGVCRSVVAACWYLSERLEMTRDEALQLIQSKRSRARPNVGFLMLIKKGVED